MHSCVMLAQHWGRSPNSGCVCWLDEHRSKTFSCGYRTEQDPKCIADGRESGPEPVGDQHELSEAPQTLPRSSFCTDFLRDESDTACRGTHRATEERRRHPADRSRSARSFRSDDFRPAVQSVFDGYRTSDVDAAADAAVGEDRAERGDRSAKAFGRHPQVPGIGPSGSGGRIH